MRRFMCAVVLLWAGVAGAADWSLLEDAGLLGLGAVASFTTHELGHEVVARALHENISWNFADATWHITKPDHIAAVSLAGFATQGLATEALLASPLPRNNAFLIGFAAYYAVNTTQYLVHSATTHGGYGDLANFAHSDRNVVSVFLAAHAALVTWRLIQPDSVPAFLRVTADTIGVGWRF